MAAKIRRNDTVEILTGKDRGRRGQVERVFPKESRVLVQGINIVKRHQRAQPGVRQGGIIERPNPLHISNVHLVCTHCSKPTRVGFLFLEDGRKVRQCKRCHETID
ncbi:MAG: 50S ribosomal protein L24 [Chloroflexi bacterium]|nr:50S ribosomal protein L24 [Chloroflexota bacterium]